MTELVVILDGIEAGRIHQNAGRLKFRYCERWLALQGAYPVSTAMPLLIQDHSHARIEPFLWGLLPDNEQTLSRWGQYFQVSPRNPFALLSNVGRTVREPYNLHRPRSSISCLVQQLLRMSSGWTNARFPTGSNC
ncbi:HipA N-terminal domain-containing protein [Hyphomonas sp.]|uniref:HipA N-terminal domain-containing protein n=1 Tax=Hyphomonas sp. TaxID=87 RepID=UPI00349FEB4E